MTKDEIQILKNAIDNPENLSEWEYEFIASIAEAPDDYELSRRQAAILNEIAEKL